MSQRKAKEYRRAMEQYNGVAKDVDDLKRRVGVLEARHYREDRDKAMDMIQRRAAAKERADLERERAMKRAEYERKAAKLRAAERRRRAARRRVITLALGALAVVMILASVIMTITAKPGGGGRRGRDHRRRRHFPAGHSGKREPDMWDGEGEDPLEAEKIEEALLALRVFLRGGAYVLRIPGLYADLLRGL